MVIVASLPLGDPFVGPVVNDLNRVSLILAGVWKVRLHCPIVVVHEFNEGDLAQGHAVVGRMRATGQRLLFAVQPVFRKLVDRLTLISEGAG